jgi:hypothetical protein
MQVHDGLASPSLAWQASAGLESLQLSGQGTNRLSSQLSTLLAAAESASLKSTLSVLLEAAGSRAGAPAWLLVLADFRGTWHG